MTRRTETPQPHSDRGRLPPQSGKACAVGACGRRCLGRRRRRDDAHRRGAPPSYVRRLTRRAGHHDRCPGASRAACSAPSPEPERARDAGRRRTRATRPLLWVLQFISGDDALLQISCGSGVSVAWTSRRRTVAIAPQGHRAGRSRRATADAASARGRSFPLSKRLPSARAPPGHYRRPLRYCVARPSRPMTVRMGSSTAQATTAIACASGSDMSTTGKRLHNATWPLLGDPRS